jgi:regulator of RNase E activity RraA
VVDFRCPIEFDNGCRVMDGDLLVGDCDGAVAVPKASVSGIIAAALAKSDTERTVVSMIDEGHPTEDIFRSTGGM